MAEHDILDLWIAAAGQSQPERTPAELGGHHFDVDERTPADLLRYQQRLAELLLFFRDRPDQATGDWTPFFPEDAAAGASDGRRKPHLALCDTFAVLHELPRELVNRFAGRHLDFFYQTVLGFRPRPAVPDRAHVLIELKKGTAPVLIEPALELSAGKDARGVERIYRPVLATPINTARVASLRSLHVDARGRVYRADVADSADGQGAKLPAGGSWPAFGHPGLPAASLGFAIAAPLLRLRGGRRQIRLRLSLSGADALRHKTAALAASLEAFLTGEKGWIGPLTPRLAPSADARSGQVALDLYFQLAAELPAVVDARPALHGLGVEQGATAAPLLRVLLKPDGALAPADLRGAAVRSVEIEVEVAGLGGFQAENDQGRLDVGKAFLPFGPQPVQGGRLLLRDAEVFAKPLSRLELELSWQGPPADFAAWYQGYSGAAAAGDATFTVAYTAVDGLGRTRSGQGRRLFGNDTRHQTLRLDLEPGAATPGAAGEPGSLTLSLERDFLHAAYRQESLAKILAYAKAAPTATPTPPVLLNEPYTPTLQGLALGYRASARLDLEGATVDDALDLPAGLRFFHLLPFGSRREHGALRAGLPHAAERRVPLLPPFAEGGELLIGLAPLQGGDSVSLLIQVAEGSADPEAIRAPLSFSVLAGDHWRPLAPAEVYRDATGQLLRSGLLGLLCPAEATSSHHAMPADLTWFRVAAAGDVGAFCRLVAVAAGGVEVVFEDRGNDPAHTRTALPAGSIDKAKRGAPAALKAVRQPYASFRFAPAESSEALHTRAAERLRHRGRALTAWDYERLVLGEFPGVHRVKCIAHADGEDFFCPGAVLLVVLPDLRNRNAVDPLRPRVDADTLAAIAAFLRPRCAAGIRLVVRNPRYQEVQLDFGVRFRAGLEFNLHRDRLERSLIEFLAPWAFDAARPLTFGGRLYRSVLLEHIEQAAAVDFVRDFRLFGPDASGRQVELAEAFPHRPDAILVPAASHQLREVAS